MPTGKGSSFSLSSLACFLLREHRRACLSNVQGTHQKNEWQSHKLRGKEVMGETAYKTVTGRMNITCRALLPVLPALVGLPVTVVVSDKQDMLTHCPECSSPAFPTLQQYRHSNPWHRFSAPAHTHYLDREASERYLCTGLTTWFHLEGVVWNRSSVQANAVIQGIFHLKEKIQPHCWKKNIERRHSRTCGLGYTTGGQQTQPAEGDLILPISEAGGQPWDGELRGSSKGCICKGNRGGGEKEQDVGKKEKKGSLSGPRRKNGLGPDGFDPLTALGFKPCLSTMKQF